MEHLGNLYIEEGRCQYDGYAGGQWVVIGYYIRQEGCAVWHTPPIAIFLKSEFHANSLTAVLHHFTLRIVEVEVAGLVFLHEYYIETTVFQHTLESTITLAEADSFVGIVIGNHDGGILTLLVVVVASLVFVELERSVLTLIDIEIDEFGRFLVAPLHGRTKWNDGTFTYENRNLLVGCINYQTLTTIIVFASIEIIPTTLFGEIYATVASLVVANRTSHERRTKHPLVADILHFLIAIEIHNECTHQRIVFEVSPCSHAVHIRHQAIAQLVVINKRLIGRMIVGSDVPDFASRPLTMRTEQGDEGSKLIPASLEFTPFLQIFVLFTCFVEEFLSRHIAVFYTEATLVHSPERHTRHRIVESGCHLSAHILPTGADITTPSGCRIALFTSETATGEQEHTRFVGFTLPYRTLSVVDSIGIDGRIGIEIFGRSAEGSRSAKC